MQVYHLQQNEPITQHLVDAMRWFETIGGSSTCSRILDLGHEQVIFTALRFIFVEGKTASSSGCRTRKVNGN